MPCSFSHVSFACVSRTLFIRAHTVNACAFCSTSTLAPTRHRWCPCVCMCAIMLIKWSNYCRVVCVQTLSPYVRNDPHSPQPFTKGLNAFLCYVRWTQPTDTKRNDTHTPNDTQNDARHTNAICDQRGQAIRTKVEVRTSGFESLQSKWLFCICFGNINMHSKLSLALSLCAVCGRVRMYTIVYRWLMWSRSACCVRASLTLRQIANDTHAYTWNEHAPERCTVWLSVICIYVQRMHSKIQHVVNVFRCCGCFHFNLHCTIAKSGGISRRRIISSK